MDRLFQQFDQIVSNITLNAISASVAGHITSLKSALSVMNGLDTFPLTLLELSTTISRLSANQFLQFGSSTRTSLEFYILVLTPLVLLFSLLRLKPGSSGLSPRIRFNQSDEVWEPMMDWLHKQPSIKTSHNLRGITALGADPHQNQQENCYFLSVSGLWSPPHSTPTELRIEFCF